MTLPKHKFIAIFSIAIGALWIAMAAVLGQDNTMLLARIGPYALVLLACACIMVIYTKTLRHEPVLLAAAIFSAMAQCIFLLKNQPQGYTYDLGAHMNTITFFGKHPGALFQPFGDGNESHQPPLYYILSGLLYWLNGYIGQPQTAMLTVSSLNYVFFSLFLLYGLLAIRHAVRTPALSWLAAAALLAWPANLLHGFRISNDVLLYLAFAGAGYHFMRWYESQAHTQLRSCLLWMAVGCATKNSALLMFPLFAFLLARRQCSGRAPIQWAAQLIAYIRSLPLRPLRGALIVLTLALAIGVGRNAYNAIAVGRTTVLEGKFAAPSTFKFTPQVLVEFEPVAYFAYPFTYHIDGKDDWFWNMYLRTLSFGEYRWDSLHIATTMNALMLCMWGFFMALSIAHLARRKAPYGWAGFYLTHVASFVLATMFIRMVFGGYVPWADARHLYSVVICFLIAYTSMLESTPSLPRALRVLGIALLAAYILVSLVHTSIQLGSDNRLPIPKPREVMVKVPGLFNPNLK